MFPLTCQCDGARWVAATHRVVMDTLCVRLGLIRGLTLLSRHHSPSLSIVDEFKQESGLSVRAIACSTCYSQAYLMSPWCYRWTCLFLMQFTHKVSSLLPVWRSRVQVNQNLMTALGITAEITRLNLTLYAGLSLHFESPVALFSTPIVSLLLSGVNYINNRQFHL